ncbi:hypothetical protein N7465_004196 [Penicillium sp. CMV-2018d]|nr:hypothetical protein N7465_004196 [Penicillium sp. CMV-2018d]
MLPFLLYLDSAVVRRVCPSEVVESSDQVADRRRNKPGSSPRTWQTRLSIIINLVNSRTHIAVDWKPKLVSLRQNRKKLMAGTGNAIGDLRRQTKQA